MNGATRLTTNQEGRYTLESVRTGSYTITAQRNGVEFQGLDQFKIAPSLEKLPDIVAVSFALSGRVIVEQGSRKRTVQLKPASEAQVEQRTTCDADGSFSFRAAPGQYVISPVVSASEVASGFMLTPSQHIVSIRNEPISDIVFSQSSVEVGGSVQCFSKCPPGIQVQLISASAATSPVTISLNADSSFLFKPVIPGQYTVNVLYAGWCWENRAQSLAVSTQNIGDLRFVQSGYELSIVSTHEVTTRLSKRGDNGAEKSTHTIVPGASTICVPSPGLFDLSIESSCIRFAQPVYHFDTDKPQQISLAPTHFRLAGLIKLTEFDPSLKLSVTDATSQSSAVEIVKTDDGVSYEHWAHGTESLTFQPVSDTLLFYPPVRTVAARVSPNGCAYPIEPFVGRRGTFLVGSVTPAMAGVIIKVAPGNAEGRTDKDGNYRIGPLYDDQEYQTTAVLEGFHFEQHVPGHFRSISLGRVEVKVSDSDTGEALSGVLLSLSGEAYRNNNGTLADGTQVFHSLFAGSYFLRALLKEFVFDPPSKEVNVKEGDLIQIEFKGKRVAFSAFGHVQSLNGEPEKFAAIEALSSDGKYEESVSDAEGKFRLRGLLPSTTYIVRLKGGEANPRLERSAPTELQLAMGKQDAKDIVIVVFRRMTKCDLTGHVNAPPDVRSTLKVLLHTGSGSRHDNIATFELGAANYFEFASLAKGQSYHLSLKTSLSKRHYNIHSDSLTVHIKEAHTHVALNFTAEPRIERDDQRDTSGALSTIRPSIAAASSASHCVRMSMARQPVLARGTHFGVSQASTSYC